MTTQLHQVQIGIFEGPIDMLLALIRQRKLPINEVSLSQVADTFITNMQKMDGYHYGHVTSFLVVASTLMLIKSRSLLPFLKLTDDEEETIDDLQLRLKLLQAYQDMGQEIEQQFGARPMVARPFVARDVVFAPPQNMQLSELASVLEDALQSAPTPVVMKQEVVKTVIHIEDMMNRLSQRISQGMKMSFNEFTGKGRGATSPQEFQQIKTEVIVGFLAMLEMVRNSIVSVSQRENFEDMEIDSA